MTWRHVAGHSGNKWNDYVDELAARGRQGDRGSNAAEWADDTIPTDTPDEESNAEGSDSSSSGHGATGGGQDSEREDDSDADCGPATPTATTPASPVSHHSPATDPEAAPVATLAVPPEFERDGPSTCRASRRGRSETIGERDAYLPSMLTLHHSPRTTPLSHLLWSLSRYATRSPTWQQGLTPSR